MLLVRYLDRYPGRCTAGTRVGLPEVRFAGCSHGRRPPGGSHNPIGVAPDRSKEDERQGQAHPAVERNTAGCLQRQIPSCWGEDRLPFKLVADVSSNVDPGAMER